MFAVGDFNTGRCSKVNPIIFTLLDSLMVTSALLASAAQQELRSTSGCGGNVKITMEKLNGIKRQFYCWNSKTIELYCD